LEEGFINNIFGMNYEGVFISWFGDKNINFVVVFVVVFWCYIGYIMVLYLVGLKSVDLFFCEVVVIDGVFE